MPTSPSQRPKRSERISFANAMSVIAVFIALGGTAYAVGTASITSRQIKDGTIKGIDVGADSLGGDDIREASLHIPTGITPQQVRFKLRQVDGSGSEVDADFLDGRSFHEFLPADGKAVSADRLDGLDSTAFTQQVFVASDTWDPERLTSGTCDVHTISAPLDIQPTDTLLVSINGTWAAPMPVYGTVGPAGLNAITCNVGSAATNTGPVTVNYRVVR